MQLPDSIFWGVTFSKSEAAALGLDWRETYSAILDELKPKAVRLPIYWQDIESQSGQYVFDDYDWLVQEAQKREIKLVLVIGRKVPRWPECHVPDWAAGLNDKSQQTRILKLIPEIANHYKGLPNLLAWQVENEPFFSFGKCPKLNVDFLDQEIKIVRSLDSQHPIMLTDSGEFGWWFRAAKRADILGITMYRVVWHKTFGQIRYPFPAKYFSFKAELLHLFFPQKPIVVSELQAESWGPKPIQDMTLVEQAQSMNLSQFYDNINYAKQAGFRDVYLWGAEWWYWLKTKHNQPEIWEVARKVMSGE